MSKTALEPVTFDPVKHQYFRGLQELVSVSKVIRETWPVKPSWDGVDPAVIENARDRGVEVDTLFSSWINGTLRSIPAGTRQDAVDRFAALREWWGDSRPPTTAQVILADEEIAGTCDIAGNVGAMKGAYILDLKNTAAVEKTYSFQLGAYAELYQKQYGTLPNVGVIHVTQPKGKPVSVKLLDFDTTVCVSEWKMIREFWNLVRRKTA